MLPVYIAGLCIDLTDILQIIPLTNQNYKQSLGALTNMMKACMRRAASHSDVSLPMSRLGESHKAKLHTKKPVVVVYLLSKQVMCLHAFGCENQWNLNSENHDTNVVWHN
jgi:hypothetical protein